MRRSALATMGGEQGVAIGSALGLAQTEASDPLSRGLLTLLLLGVFLALYRALPLAQDLARARGDGPAPSRGFAVRGLSLLTLLLLGLSAFAVDVTDLYRPFAVVYLLFVAAAALAAWRPAGARSPAALPRELRALTLPQAVARAALLLWTVGAAWLLIDAFGLRPMGFVASIVRLTAIHFHYAAFIVPVIAAHVARAQPSSLARAAAVVSVLGAPSTAIGITAVQRGAPLWLEALFALPMIGGALLVAAVHLRMAWAPPGRASSPLVRGLRLVVGLSLLGTMFLAAAYAGRGSLPWSPTIPQMALWHGVGNALGVAFCGLVACQLDRR